jgi:aspartate aminotransferase
MTSSVNTPMLSRRMNSIEMSSTSATVNAVAELRESGMRVINLGPGEPHFATPEHVKSAATDAIRNNQTRYTPVPGTTELRNAIAQRHHLDFGSQYNLEEVIACPGGKYALFKAVQVLINEGDEVIIPMPYWVSFKDMIRFAGGKCVFVDTTRCNFRLTSHMIEKVLTPRTKAIILNYPNNPSGALMDATELERIVEIAIDRDIWLISDECYVYLTFSGKPLSASSFNSSRTHVVVVGSLSKTYAMTGWRLGYAMAPSRVIAAMETLQSQEISCPSSVSQAAAIAALTGPQDCIGAMKAEYLRQRDVAMAGLSSIPGVRATVPGGAFYVFPDVSDHLRARKLRGARELSAVLLRQQGVAIVPGEGFGSSNHVRISFSVSQQELSLGLQKLRHFFLAQD